MADVKFGVRFTAGDHLSGPTAKVGAEFDRLRDKLGRFVKGPQIPPSFSARLASAARSMSKMGESLRGIGKGMMLGGAEMSAPGVAIGYALKGMVESSEEFENHIGRVAAALGNVPDKAAQLAKAEEYIKKESVAAGVGIDDVTESVYQGLSGFLTLNEAIATTTESAIVARATQGNLADTQKLMTTMMINFGDKTKTPIQQAAILGDKLAKLQTGYKFTTLEDLTEAMRYAGPAALAYSVSLEQAAGSLAALSAGGITGAGAGVAFREIVSELSKKAPKLGITLIRDKAGQLDLIKTFDEIQKRFGSVEAKTMLTNTLGPRAGANLQIVLRHLDKMQAATVGVANSTGAAQQAEAEFEKRGTMAWERVGAAVHVLMVDIGKQFAPTLAGVATQLTARLGDVAKWVDAHGPEIQGVIKGIAVTLGDMAKELGAIIGRVVKFGEAHPAIAKLALKFAILGPIISIVSGALVTVAGAFTLVAGAFVTVAGAVTFLAGSAVAGPLALIALFAAAAYEIYDRWVILRTFFVDLWTGVKAEFVKFETWLKPWEDWLKGAGLNMMKSLGEGILSGLEWPFKAAEHVAEKVGSFFHFHSPPDIGPLKDAFENFRFCEELADMIRAGSSMVTDAVSATFSAAVSAGSAAIHAAAPVIEHAWQGATHAVAPIVKRTWEGIKSLTGAASGAVLHGLMGTESSYGKNLTNPTSSAIGPYQMTKGFRATWGITPEEAMSMAGSTAAANRVIFGHYLPEFGGDVAKALSAWHQGEGWVRSHGVDRAYVDSVMHHMAGGGAPTVHLTVNYTHNGSAPTDFNPRKHADAISRIVKDSLAREARLRFS